MKIEPKKFLPVEIVFHPNWWYKNYSITFGWDYFFNPDVRVMIEQKMSQILYEKFGQYGYGKKNPAPEPVIGPIHLAAGFIFSAIWGCDIRYYLDASPQVVCRKMTIDQLDNMPEPDPLMCKEFAALVKMIQLFKHRFGCVKGDVGWHSLQNLALDLIGENVL